MSDSSVEQEVVRLLSVRRGHFRLESGHHGDLWLDLELLCLDARGVRRIAAELAARVGRHDVEMVCGPLVEGAFVALMVAAELGVPFGYSERFENRASDVLYPVTYQIPHALRERVAGKRVAIVNDVVNAGSAVLGTLADLEACRAQPVAIGTLLVLGSSAARIASERGLALDTLASLPNTIWTPAECPLCRRHVPLTR